MLANTLHPQLEESVGSLLEADEVEFGVTLNLRSGARKARAISMLARSTDRRELGKVICNLASRGWGCYHSNSVLSLSSAQELSCTLDRTCLRSCVVKDLAAFESESWSHNFQE